MFPNGMSPTDQCIRIEVNIKPQENLKLNYLENFFGFFKLCSLKKKKKNQM